MSRVGKKEIVVPSSVSFTRQDNVLTFKKDKTEEQYVLPQSVALEADGNSLKLTAKDDSKEARSLWGTTQRNIANIIKGLSEGFTYKLTLVGVGNKAAVSGNNVTLNLGFSHPVNCEIPEGLTVQCPTPTEILIKGTSKQAAGKFASDLRGHRPPEPYKGKGVRYADEHVVIKEGKKK